MKKMLFLLLTGVLFLATGVKAMSEDDLQAKFTKSYEMNGSTYSLSEGDKALVKRYLKQNEVSSKDCDYIAGKVDEAISLMRKSGVKDLSEFSKFPKSLKDDLKKLVEDIAANTKVKATTKKGSVVIYNTDGTVFAEITKFIKNTGTNVNIIPTVALFASILGIALVVKNIKANA